MEASGETACHNIQTSPLVLRIVTRTPLHHVLCVELSNFVLGGASSVSWLDFLSHPKVFVLLLALRMHVNEELGSYSAWRFMPIADTMYSAILY